MNNKGFTLIELSIVVAILAILLTLVVVNLNDSMAEARDSERAGDIETIARGLERRYADGNPRASGAGIMKNAYPGTDEILHAQGQPVAAFSPPQIQDGYLTELLPGISKDALTPPDGGSFAVICSASCQPAETESVVNSIVTTDKYIYEPITTNGSVCAGGDCIRYNLYYRTEVDNAVHKLRSQHQ